MVIQILSRLQYFLYWKGRFNDVRKIEHAILTAVGVILPFVDVFETLIGLRYEIEGNPFINSTPPEYHLPLLIITHIGYSALVFILGWKGKSQEKVRVQFALVLFVVFMVIVTVINAILLKWYGVL